MELTLTLDILREVFMLNTANGDSSFLDRLCLRLAATEPVLVSCTPKSSRIKTLLLPGEGESQERDLVKYYFIYKTTTSFIKLLLHL